MLNVPTFRYGQGRQLARFNVHITMNRAFSRNTFSFDEALEKNYIRITYKFIRRITSLSTLSRL